MSSLSHEEYPHSYLGVILVQVVLVPYFKEKYCFRVGLADLNHLRQFHVSVVVTLNGK
jgi:hypothetical protein